jgi:hypothetical protein
MTDPDEPGSSPMPVLSVAEEYQHIARQKCACGGVFEPTQQFVCDSPSGKLDTIETKCGECGDPRRFEFLLVSPDRNNPTNPESKVPDGESLTKEELLCQIAELKRLSDQHRANLSPKSAETPSQPRFRFAQYLVIWLSIILPVLAFAWFVWPTRYRYDRMDFSNGVSYPVRINRFSEKSEVLTPDRGWVDLAARARSITAKPEDQTLPLEELQKLSGKAEANLLGLTIHLYNGSEWNVNEITVEFWMSSKRQGETRRRYRIKKVYPAEPFQTTMFQTDLDSWPTESQK